MNASSAVLRRALLRAMLALALLSRTSAAQTDAERLDQAKQQFYYGVTLLEAGDVERALEHFRRSRELVPSGKNTANMAICLDRLGRFDEALEAYEELLLRFSADLDEDDRRSIAPAMAELRLKVGSIELASNVAGLVVVDGRARGRLPLEIPIRVLAGRHVVRVMKDGYQCFEAVIDAEVGQTVRVDARLTPLKGVGLLRVEDPANEGSAVYVDAVHVGRSPWEGPLSPGRHLVWTAKGDVGSAPALIAVTERQTTLARVASSRLGPELRIDADPPTAQILLDDVPVGKRSWSGRLPIGSYELVLLEPGYHEFRRELTIPPRDASLHVAAHAEIDRGHPRWPSAWRGQPNLGAFGGFAVGPTLGSDAEQSCPEACNTRSMATGFIAGARAAYRVELGIAGELSAGYASLGSRLRRMVSKPFAGGVDNAVEYSVEDALSVHGPFVAVGASHRLPLSPRAALYGRVAFGAFLAGARDRVQVGAATTQVPRSEPLELATREAAAEQALTLIILPEVGANVAVGRMELGLGIGMVILPLPGPELTGAVGVADPLPCQSQTALSGAAECAPDAALPDGERAFGPSLLVMPGVYAAYVF